MLPVHSAVALLTYEVPIVALVNVAGGESGAHRALVDGLHAVPPHHLRHDDFNKMNLCLPTEIKCTAQAILHTRRDCDQRMDE